MYKGETWRCVNPECHAEMVVTEPSQMTSVRQPRCGCGTVMKKIYQKPAIQKVALKVTP
jgi:hypothetical protein